MLLPHDGRRLAYAWSSPGRDHDTHRRSANASGDSPRLRALGLDFPERAEPHGSLSTVLTTKALIDHGVPPRLARSVGAHHGEFASLEKLGELEQEKGVLHPGYAGNTALWALLRAHLVLALAGACGRSSSRASTSTSIS